MEVGFVAFVDLADAEVDGIAVDLALFLKGEGGQVVTHPVAEALKGLALVRLGEAAVDEEVHLNGWILLQEGGLGLEVIEEEGEGTGVELLGDYVLAVGHLDAVLEFAEDVVGVEHVGGDLDGVVGAAAGTDALEGDPEFLELEAFEVTLLQFFLPLLQFFPHPLMSFEEFGVPVALPEFFEHGHACGVGVLADAVVGHELAEEFHGEGKEVFELLFVKGLLGKKFMVKDLPLEKVGGVVGGEADEAVKEGGDALVFVKEGGVHEVAEVAKFPGVEGLKGFGEFAFAHGAVFRG